MDGKYLSFQDQFLVHISHFQVGSYHPTRILPLAEEALPAPITSFATTDIAAKKSPRKNTTYPNLPPARKAARKRATPSHLLPPKPTGQPSTTTAPHLPLSRIPSSERKNLLHLPPPKSAQSLLPHSTKIPAPKRTTRPSFLPASHSASSKLTPDSRTLPI